VPVDGPQYPVNLVLTGRRCLVVGGGHIAVRKIEGLLTANAEVHVIASEVSQVVRALPVTFEERPYREGDVIGYRLVVTATDSAEVNRSVFLDGEANNIWVNAADEPASCSFTLPAIARRGPIMVTVSTGGHSPALGTWLRGHVERELGEEYEQFVLALSRLREEIKAAGGSTEDLDWQAAFRDGAMARVRAGDIGGAEQFLRKRFHLDN
jgi:precorrin-2 dehydrogenase/sirohydrochlorin ferrochelatase